MKNWITIADRLRIVKRAHEEYLFRAFVDRLIIGPMLLDRLAADLGSAFRGRDEPIRRCRISGSRPMMIERSLTRSGRGTNPG